MALLSFELSCRGVARFFCLLMVLALAVRAPQVGSVTASDRPAAAGNASVIIPVTDPGDGHPNLPSRHVAGETQQKATEVSCVPECLLLPRTVLLRSGAIPSAAPRGRLLVTQWTTTSL